METLATGLLIFGTVSFAKKLILYFALRVWLSVVAFESERVRPRGASTSA